MTPIEAVKRANAILIVCHIRPDGDCLGAGFALKRIAERMGKTVDFLVDSEPPAPYAFIPGFDSLNQKKSARYDLGIALDCADDMRVGKLIGAFLACKDTWNIDHHGTNNRFAKNNIVREISSTCELLYGLIKDEADIDPVAATCFLLGISTDTGHFMHSNTSSSTLMAAAELMEKGADLGLIVSGFYKNNPRKKLDLIARALGEMKYYRGGEIAFITVTARMLEECGCDIADTEGLIDYPMTVGDVKVAVCMTEQRSKAYKVSFRSKSVDVAAIASIFGGGGHKQASGCALCGYREDVTAKVIGALNDAMSV